MSLLRTLLALVLLLPIQDAARKAPPPGAGEGSCSEAGCHADLGERPVVHGVVAEAMCDTCHEPAGEGHAFSLTAESIGDVCVSCHEDPREAGSHVHAAAAQGECTACHDPHGSDVKGLLLAEGGDLCTGCHEDPAAAEHAHAPAGGGECTACHDPHGSDVKGLLLAEGGDLCMGCHEDPAAGEHVHAPAGGGECGLCHEAHASENAYLIRQAGTALCLGCHEAQSEELAMPAVHGIVQVAGCTACHDPHSAAAPRLLHVGGNALCAACHLVPPEKREPDMEGRVTVLDGQVLPAAMLEGSPVIRLREGRGHPLAGHPVEAESNPVKPEEPFGCGSCHAPHGAQRAGLIKGGSWMSLCRQCHKK